MRSSRWSALQRLPELRPRDRPLPVSRTATSRLLDDQGRIEFIARSLPGGHICGVTAEEYDYWVVSLAL